MNVVFLSYYNQSSFSSPELWIERIKTWVALMEAMASQCNVTYVTQMNYEGSISKKGIDYIFLKSRYKKSFFPRRLNKKVKDLQPDIVIVSGIRSPLQIIQLRWRLGKKVIFLGRHHHDRTPTGIRRILQRLTDKCFNAYLFTSLGNAQEWFDTGIIEPGKKIYELVEASTGLSRLDKEMSKQSTGMKGHYNFLWVSRLNTTKDPFTVLKGFEKYLLAEPTAKLYMIYDVEDLLPEVNAAISENEILEKAVILKGYISNEELPAWYSAADFYISGSHSEGGSYALLEAMACGCIPIVTAIPAALKMTGNGKYGIVFQPGNANDLGEKLAGLSLIATEDFSASVENYFRKELSTTATADKLFGYCQELMGE